MKKYTREELINLCLAGSVPQKEWSNRDTARAQMQLGENLFLLMAGCEYTLDPEIRHGAIWITFEYKGFDYFEGGYDHYDERPLSTEYGYIPTQERLDQANGGDWY